LLTGTAKAVQRHPGNGLGPAGQQDGQARDVVAVVAGQNAVAGDHVIDVDRLEADALGKRGQARREQGLRMNSVQSAVGAASPPRRAYRVENPGVDVGLRSLCASIPVDSPDRNGSLDLGE
jgi:hypothetical protein